MNNDGSPGSRGSGVRQSAAILGTFTGAIGAPLLDAFGEPTGSAALSALSAALVGMVGGAVVGLVIGMLMYVMPEDPNNRREREFWSFLPGSKPEEEGLSLNVCLLIGLIGGGGWGIYDAIQHGSILRRFNLDNIYVGTIAAAIVFGWLGWLLGVVYDAITTDGRSQR